MTKTLDFLFYNLHLKNLKGDFMGGLTAAIVALPLSLAFGIASGLGAAAGLYSAILLGFFAALFGGAPSQISGPNGPMTVVMAGIVLQFPDRPDLCFAAVILGGFFLVIAGWLKLGKYISLVPYSVISGFMSGVGIIIITLQLDTILGYASFADMFGAIRNLPQHFLHPNADALALGLISLAIVIFSPAKIRRIVPPPLIALIIGTILGILLFPEAPRIGQIPQSLPNPHLPGITLEDLVRMILPALMLACLCGIDSLMTATVADTMTRIYHKPDKELVGQGIGNILAGLFGGIAGSGAMMRTSVNIRAGGRTPLSGAIHALLLLSVLLGLAPLAQMIPHAVLGGILLKVGFDIIDWDFIKRFKTAPKSSVFFMLVVVFLTVFVDLIAAVIVGMVLASLALVKELADLQLSEMRLKPLHANSPELSPEEKSVLSALENKIILFQPSGPLSFGAASRMIRAFGVIHAYEAILFDFLAVQYIDTTSTLAIETIIGQTQEQNKEVYFVNLSKDVSSMFFKLGLFERLGPYGLQPSRLDALRHFAERKTIRSV